MSDAALRYPIATARAAEEAGHSYDLVLGVDPMTRDLSRPLQPGRVAFMFGLGGLIGMGGVFVGLFVVRRGPFALIVPALAFFIGGAMASASLRTGLRGMISFGLAFVVGGVGSLLLVVGTQAMGGESPFYIIFVFLVYMGVAWGVGGLIALFPLFGWSYVLGLGLIGFSGGGAVGGLILALAVVSGFQFFWVATTVGVVVASAIGGGVVAWAMNSRSAA